MKGQKVVHSKSTPASDEWETPRDLFTFWCDLYRLNFDAAASAKNHKLPAYYTKRDNSLVRDWNGRVWCNPPYSRVADFVSKAVHEIENNPNCEIVVMLVPARTGTRWFHEYVLSYKPCQVVFLKGRICFEKEGEPIKYKTKAGKWAKGSAPFDSALLIYRKGKPDEAKR